MDKEEPRIAPTKTLWTYLREGVERAHKQRPVSFYLLLAIPMALLLGGRLLDARSSPKQFAFYLSLFFVFFFMLMYRAIIDLIEIARRHFTEHEHVFRHTLGEEEFVSKLGSRVKVGPISNGTTEETD